MNLILRIGAALFFGGFLVYVLRLVSNGKMLLKYSLLWILMCMAALLIELPCSKRNLRNGLIMNELNTWFDSVPLAIPH